MQTHVRSVPTRYYFYLMAYAIISVQVVCKMIRAQTGSHKHLTCQTHMYQPELRSVVAVSIFTCQSMPLRLQLPSGRLTQGTFHSGYKPDSLQFYRLMLKAIAVPCLCDYILPPISSNFTEKKLRTLKKVRSFSVFSAFL